MKFVFDLDGTLCFDGRSLTEEIHAILGKAQDYGHEIAFASARSYRDCVDVLGSSLAQKLVVGLNGGLAYQEGRLIFHRTLDPAGYQDALSWCHQYNLPYFIDDDFNYSSQQMEKIPFARHVDPLHLAQHIPVSDLHHPIKMVVEMSRHEELVEDFCHSLRQLDSLDVQYHEHEKCLYINPYETNKATTVVALLGEDFVAFGNDKNDKELFKHSLYSVQVGHYSPLKAYADEEILAESRVVAEKIQELFEKFSPLA